jgi:hypothetical protein
MMIVYSDRTVVTATVLDWAADESTRMAWLADCLARHLTADWGDLDLEDRAANDHALRHGQGRVLSAYRLPAELADTARESRIWVITDDLDDPDTATTILWPSDYQTTPHPTWRPLRSRQGPPRVRPPAHSRPFTPVGADRGADFSPQTITPGVHVDHPGGLVAEQPRCSALRRRAAAYSPRAEFGHRPSVDHERSSPAGEGAGER